jgi:hypothetical protein
MKMKKDRSKTIWLALVAVFIIALAMSSCQKAPYYHVDSLDELKAELEDYPEILFPDLSEYKMDANYRIKQWEQDRNVLNGYSISCYDSVTVGDLNFSKIEYNCIDLEHYMDKLSQPLPLNINAQYFGVDVQEWTTSILSDGDDELEGLKIPENSSSWEYDKRFDLNGVRYHFGARVFAPNDGDKSKDFSAEVELGNEEMLRLMKSIIDQSPIVAEEGGEEQ